ncbi:MAG: DNA primase [Candidatus Auribacterota bacterium]|jgi:DNA primase|nr:DNA primase [Candidatus Auribacterota bacterium]
MNFANDQDRDNIRSKIDIVELIESYIPLKKAGVNYKANCPFHKEKTPSFVVNPAKQIYHCFGCHRGGDIFSFIMEWDQITFPEAIQRLADRCGYTLTGKSNNEPAIKKSQKDRLYDCLSTAASFFHDFLRNDQRAQHARDYLHKRGIGTKTIETWKLGFIPSVSGLLRQYLQKKGYSVQELLACGLIKKDERTGTIKDRFFNRLIFPIRDEQSRIVAFGARVLDNSEPKYINSPETKLYQKSKVLYGFSDAKQSIRDEKSVLIVEGYFDVIQLHQSGLTNAVAPCGTALTEEQLAILKRYADQMFLAFDSDQAGINAVIRKLDPILEQSINAKVVTLPAGDDPDSYIKKYGAEKFSNILQQGEPLLDFRLKLLIDQYGLDDEFARTKIAQSMMSLISKVSNNLLAESWLKRIEEKLGFSQEVLRDDLAKKRNKEARITRERTNRQEITQQRGIREKENIPPWEKELMRVVILYESLILDKAKNLLQKDYFFSTIVARLWETIISGGQMSSNTLADSLLEHFRDDETVRALLTEIMSQDIEDQNPEIVFEDAFKRTKKEYIEKKISSCMESLKNAKGEDISSLLKNLHDLKQEKIKLGVF